jgi:hypothetical protein
VAKQYKDLMQLMDPEPYVLFISYEPFTNLASLQIKVCCRSSKVPHPECGKVPVSPPRGLYTPKSITTPDMLDDELLPISDVFRLVYYHIHILYSTICTRVLRFELLLSLAAYGCFFPSTPDNCLLP